MARDNYNDVVLRQKTDGNVELLSGIQISVVNAGGSTLQTIYQGRTGGTVQANPFLTDATGSINFWADPGEYDIKIHDPNVSPRVADKTIGWNSIPGADGGIPSIKLAGDGNLPLGAASAAVARQWLPIGAVIDWWRPTATFPVPAGFAICDGSAVTSANHDFGTGASITLPDLRNKFTLGANIANADGAAGTAVDAVGSAPGIGGVGGSNVQVVPAHFHGKGNLSANGGSHAHNMHSWSILFQPPASGPANTFPMIMSGGGADLGFRNDYMQTSGHAHPNSEFSGSVGNTGGSNGDAAMNGDNRGQHIGLLKIMKVKRS